MDNSTVTIRDIAKKVGVSVSTVSKVFNNYSDVSEETKAKILKAAEQMDYSPNIMARSLIKNESKRIGLLIEDYNEGDMASMRVFDMMMGFKSVMMENGYEVVLLSTTSASQKRTGISNIISSNLLDGVFVIGLKLSDPYLEEIAGGSFPCVLYDVPISRDKASSIEVDNIKGAMLATEQLIQNGHKKIGLINGHGEAFVSEERLNGYILALAKHGIPYDKNLVYESDFSEEGSRKAMEKLLEYDKDITGVFAISDLMAIGAMKYLQGLGIRVPEDISIVGYDDIDSASHTTPTLTTIRQDRKKIGETAASVLISLVNGRSLGKVQLEPELIIRESIKCI